MTETYPTVDVSSWAAPTEEVLGTKEKLWLRSPEGELWLFKVPRAKTGDDWAEKAAAELAGLMGLPHPRVELADRSRQPGTITLDFTSEAGRPVWKLALGNELLFERDPSYPKDLMRGVRQCTVDRVLDLLIQIGANAPALPVASLRTLSAPEVFTGYLMFDAWIGNQDRHHENWGVLFQVESTSGRAPTLAPSYDHAASLGQILTDDERIGRLETKDKGYAVATWVRKARAALYLRESDTKPLKSLDAFLEAQGRYPEAAKIWLERLAGVRRESVAETLERLPADRASKAACRFASEMLEENRRQLLGTP